jgi:hypothetical protein
MSKLVRCMKLEALIMTLFREKISTVIFYDVIIFSESLSTSGFEIRL